MNDYTNDYEPDRTVWSLTNLGSGVRYKFRNFSVTNRKIDSNYAIEIQQLDSCGLRVGHRFRTRKLAREIWLELVNNGWVKS